MAHSELNNYCSLVDKNEPLDNTVGNNGFIILKDGSIFQLKKKYTHDTTIVMIFFDEIQQELLDNKIDFDYIKDTAQSSLILNKITYDLPVIRITQRRTYEGSVYYDLWYTDDSITTKSYNSFAYVCDKIYGVDGNESVDGPSIYTTICIMNTYRIHMKNLINK